MADTVYDKLIKLCIEGDRAAQKKLYDKLAPRMLSLCIRYMGDRMAAEDILQDGFVTLFSKLDTYKGIGSFEGWARRIFVNTALMQLRKKDALYMSQDIDSIRSLHAHTTSQVQDLAYKDLMDAMVDMPAGFRTVFNMYIVEGYSHREIGEILGITETTSRTQLSRARVWLQKKLKILGYER